jgi:hypothetical protein
VWWSRRGVLVQFRERGLVIEFGHGGAEVRADPVQGLMPVML